jgi:hypothetical protein
MPVVPIGSIQARRDAHPFASIMQHAWRAKNADILTRDGSASLWPDSHGALSASQGTAGNRPIHDSTDSAFGATTGESVAFDGTDDYMDTSSSAAALSTCAFGVVFRTGATGAARTVFSMGTAPLSGGMELRYTAGSNLLWVSWDAVNAQSGKFFGISANTVYRVIANWDPVVGSYAWSLWNAGVSTGTDNGSVVNTPSNQTGIVRLGQNTALTQPFNGRTYLIERFTRTLTAPEVATLDAYYAGLLV